MPKDKAEKVTKAKGKATAKAEAKTKKAVVKAVKGKYTFFSPIPALTQCGLYLTLKQSHTVICCLLNTK